LNFKIKSELKAGCANVSQKLCDQVNKVNFKAFKVTLIFFRCSLLSA